MPANSLETIASYQTLLSSLQDALCVLDAQHDIIYLNQAYREKYCKADSYDQPISAPSCMGKRFYTSIKRDLDIALAGRSSVATRWIKGQNCKPLQLSVTFMPLLDQQQTTVAVALLFIDITHQSLSSPFDTDAENPKMPTDIEWQWEMDEDLRFTYVSSSIALSTNHDSDWFMGKTREEILALSQNTASVNDLHDSSIEKRKFLDHLESMQRREAFNNFVYSFQHAGERRWVSVCGVPIFSHDSEERFLGYRGAGRDVTPVKEAVEKHNVISHAVETISTGFAVFTRDGKLAQCNQAFLTLLSLSANQIRANCTLRKILVDCYLSGKLPPLGSSLEAWVAQMIEHFYLPKTQDEWRTTDGFWLGCESEFTADGLIILQVSDITPQKVAERKLASESRLLRSVINSLPDAVYVLDQEHRYICANPQVAKIHGIEDPALLIGSTGLEKFSRARSVQILSEERAILKTGQPALNREMNYLVQGQEPSERTYTVSKVALRDKKNQIIGIVGHAKDITYLRSLTDKLSWQAEHDELTGLINRRGFDQKLQSALQEYKLHNRQSVLCFVDLDQFKIVNDTVGHKAGDELLCRISGLVNQHIRADDTFARLGGDEFGLIFNDCSISEAEGWVSNIIEAITKYRFQREDKVFDLGASVGMVALDSAGQTSQSVLSQADVACYTAKELGRRRFHVYTSSDEESTWRQRLLNQAAEIRSALDENRFTLYAQSISSFQGGLITANHYEVLVRMIGRDGKLIPPGEFIPAAERYALMSAVDRWVIVNTFVFLSAQNNPQQVLKIAINLSGNSLNEPDMSGFIKQQIQRYKVDPSCLCFELTETSIVSNISMAQSLMHELQEIGCTFALDDFGSGLSSFAYLKKFKVDYLKIDGSFVRNIVDDPTDRAMVAAIHNVGRALGIETIAEFVETAEHIKVLQGLGVDYFQGFGIDLPQPLEHLDVNNCDSQLSGSSTAA